MECLIRGSGDVVGQEIGDRTLREISQAIALPSGGFIIFFESRDDVGENVGEESLEEKLLQNLVQI